MEKRSPLSLWNSCLLCVEKHRERLLSVEIICDLENAAVVEELCRLLGPDTLLRVEEALGRKNPNIDFQRLTSSAWQHKCHCHYWTKKKMILEALQPHKMGHFTSGTSVHSPRDIFLRYYASSYNYTQTSELDAKVRALFSTKELCARACILPSLLSCPSLGEALRLGRLTSLVLQCVEGRHAPGLLRTLDQLMSEGKLTSLSLQNMRDWTAVDFKLLFLMASGFVCETPSDYCLLCQRYKEVLSDSEELETLDNVTVSCVESIDLFDAALQPLADTRDNEGYNCRKCLLGHFNTHLGCGSFQRKGLQMLSVDYGDAATEPLLLQIVADALSHGTDLCNLHLNLPILKTQLAACSRHVMELCDEDPCCQAVSSFTLQLRDRLMQGCLDGLHLDGLFLNTHVEEPDKQCGLRTEECFLLVLQTLAVRKCKRPMQYLKIGDLSFFDNICDIHISESFDGLRCFDLAKLNLFNITCFDWLLDFIRHNTAMECLTLKTFCTISDQSCYSIMPTLVSAHGSTLRSLDLSSSIFYSGFIQKFWDCICAVLQHCPFLQYLSVASCRGLGEQQVTDMCFIEAVRMHNKTRQLTLDLSQNQLGNLHNLLVNCISESSSLKSLDIRMCCTREDLLNSMDFVLQSHTTSYQPLLNCLVVGSFLSDIDYQMDLAHSRALKDMLEKVAAKVYIVVGGDDARLDHVAMM